MKANCYQVISLILLLHGNNHCCNFDYFLKNKNSTFNIRCYYYCMEIIIAVTLMIFKRIKTVLLILDVTTIAWK